MIQLKTESTAMTPEEILAPAPATWWDRLLASRVHIVLFVLFGAFALKSTYPDLFSLSAKRHKAYRFRGDALGFFVGDLSLFTTSSAEEAENRMVEAFPEKLQPKVQKIIRPVLKLSEKHEVDPFWVLSVMWTESHFRFQVKSKKGASGLMQVMPVTYATLMDQMKHESIALESDRGERYLSTMYPEAYAELGYQGLVYKLRNLEVGIFYLKTLLTSFDRNHFHATVAYNMGPSWTKDRLRHNLPVASSENRYLDKVMKAYFHITKNISHNANSSFVTSAN